MAIDTTFPADKRLPRVVQEFDLLGRSRGQAPVERLVAVVAYKSAAGTGVADTPVEVSTDADSDRVFGPGSDGALLCRRMRGQWRRLSAQSLGAAGRIFAVPVTAPVSAAATATFTVVGTATANGTIVLRIGGRFVNVGVSLGEVQNTIAANINTAITAAGINLPVTSGVATNVVTITHRHHGLSGNRVSVSVWQTVGGVTVTPSGTAMAGGTGSPTLTTALANTLAKRYLAIATAFDLAAEVTAFKTHLDAAWGPTAHRQRFVMMGSRDSVANINTLATTSNDYRICIGAFTNTYALPLDISACMAATFVALDRPNYNWDGIDFDLPEAPDADVYEETEGESLLSSGAAPIIVDELGVVRLTRFVTTKTTESGVRVEELLDVAHPYTVARLGWDLVDRMTLIKKGANVSTQLLNSCKSSAYRYLKSRERDGWVQNVDAHAQELRVEKHESVASRIEMEVPESIVPAAHQIIVKNVMYIE